MKSLLVFSLIFLFALPAQSQVAPSFIGAMEWDSTPEQTEKALEGFLTFYSYKLEKVSEVEWQLRVGVSPYLSERATVYGGSPIFKLFFEEGKLIEIQEIWFKSTSSGQSILNLTELDLLRGNYYRERTGEEVTISAKEFGTITTLAYSRNNLFRIIFQKDY